MPSILCVNFRAPHLIVRAENRGLTSKSDSSVFICHNRTVKIRPGHLGVAMAVSRTCRPRTSDTAVSTEAARSQWWSLMIIDGYCPSWPMCGNSSTPYSTFAVMSASVYWVYWRRCAAVLLNHFSSSTRSFLCDNHYPENQCRTMSRVRVKLSCLGCQPCEFPTTAMTVMLPKPYAAVRLDVAQKVWCVWKREVAADCFSTILNFTLKWQIFL
jgi:hypothetical protein